MKKESIQKIKEGASFMRTLDELVNISINENQEFYALQKFNEQSNYKLHAKELINYTLDTYLETKDKFLSLFATYIRISSGLKAAEKFKKNQYTNPYIDGDFLDEVFDDE